MFLTRTTNLTLCRHQLSEAQHKLAAVDGTMAVIEFDLTGKVLNANSHFLTVMGGYQLDEIVGKHHRIFVTKEEADSADYAYFWTRLAAGNTFSAQYERVGKNGQAVWIQGSYNPVLDDFGNPYKIVKFATDITESVIKENETRAQLEAINRAMAVIEFDLQGNIVTANDNFLNTMGYELTEIQGKHHSMFADASDTNTPAYRQFWTDLAEGKIAKGTFKRLGKNNKIIYLEANYNPILDTHGKAYKVVKFAIDVTKQELRKQQLTRAINDSSEVLLAMAEGNLTKVMPSGVYKGELHDLKNALNYTLESLKTIVTETRQSASVVSGAANQVSLGAADLSARVQEQAAALEETSATMHHIANAVQTNTENANRVAKLASNVQQQSHAGVQVMQQTIDAMRSIEEASNKISEIVNIIDSIAFQTNLLALNAAVEAARAGEHGRGFAVVASEVRTLAGKSADAAKDIKALILDSAQRVANGTELAQKSGTTLHQISESITQVTKMVGEIAIASREQISGINQVHQAVAAIDDVTQQNAALVEQTTAAAENLNQEAQHLQANMDTFVI
ncbi:MAG: PAS domain S-box protein [Gammaproteobacteria bacterium]|nr:PAS domain S-box protein [Gammaproteobacteria bacterium]